MARSSSPRKDTTRSPRFDVSALRAAAGDKVYARGVEYHRDGQVEIVAIDTKRVVARVLGSELYRTELNGKGRDFSGECSCPAFSEWGFCKHMVATALAANAGGSEALEASHGRLARVREHLRAQGLEALIEMIMQMGERDPALFAELELAAAMDQADDKTLLAQFKKAVTEATRTSGFVEYREMRAWAQAAGAVLDRIERLIGRGKAGLVLQLLDWFFARMAAALGNIDDSEGYGGGLLERGADLHLRACQMAKPDSVALARQLFARETEAVTDVFFGASKNYAEVLGPAGLAEYRRLAEAAWAKIKPRRAERIPARDDDFGARFRLQTILQGFAERDGDVETLIALHTKDLSSAYRYLQIAELCRDHGREADALRWAEEGLWQFEKNPDERLVVFAAELYRRSGRADDADTLLWQCFERHPSLALHGKLKEAALGGKAGHVTDKAVALLKTRIGPGTERTGSAWLWGRQPADLLIQLLMEEARLDGAWEIVHAHGCAPALLEELAAASEERHPLEAIRAYGTLVEHAVATTGEPAYREACRFVARIRALRARRGDAAAHSSYIDDLLHRHKAKRNFVTLLRKAERRS